METASKTAKSRIQGRFRGHPFSVIAFLNSPLRMATRRFRAPDGTSENVPLGAGGQDEFAVGFKAAEARGWRRRRYAGEPRGPPLTVEVGAIGFV